MRYERGNKMRTATLLRLKVCFIGILMLLFSLIFACSRGEQPQEKKAAVRTTNPYSNESVFDEVQRKLKENPNDVDALFHLADLYERNAQYKEAIETYTKALKFKPEAGYIYFKMGTAYDRINQPAEAVKAFQSALKYMPSYAVAYNNMGVAYGKLNKPDEEITALNKAIKIRPKYASARYNLGMTYMKIGNRKEALRQYEALKNFDEGTAEALMKEIGKTP